MEGFDQKLYFLRFRRLKKVLSVAQPKTDVLKTLQRVDSLD